ncbi:MAG: hypothetical protein ACK4WM_08155 [Thermoflexales bacterium]
MREPKFIDFKTALGIYVVSMVLTSLLIHFVLYSSSWNTFWLK